MCSLFCTGKIIAMSDLSSTFSVKGKNIPSSRLLTSGAKSKIEILTNLLIGDENLKTNKHCQVFQDIGKEIVEKVQEVLNKSNKIMLSFKKN